MRMFRFNSAFVSLAAAICFAGSWGALSLPDQDKVRPGPQAIGHEYDPVADAAVSWSLRPGHSVGQSFATSGRALRITGFRMSLLRVGEPGDLQYAIVESNGGAEIQAGTISSRQVNPFFEGWIGADFKQPERLKANSAYRMELRLPGRLSDGYYEVFGTAASRVDSPDFNLRFQYVASWGETAALKEFENPLNLDYGSRTPVYGAGTAHADGAPVIPLDFAFRLVAEGSPPDSSEEPFAFIRSLDAPVHERRAREVPRPAQKGEIEVRGDWVLVHPDRAAVVLQTAVEDFRRYLENEMGIRITVRARKPSLSASRAIILGTPADLPSQAVELERSEAFLFDSSRGERIVICGYDDRGIMRGLQFLEDRMSMRGAPAVPAMRGTHSPLYAPRLTCTPYYAKSELEVPIDPYTDNLLSRISHHGFSGIWIWGELIRVGRSAVYPELGEGIEKRQARLREIADRAARHGLDVYIYLGSQPLPASFFDRRPDVKGTPIKAYGGDFVLCTTPEEPRRFIREATADLLRSVPRIKGVAFIVGVEGLLHCYSRGKAECPRCLKREAEEVVAEASRAVFEGARGANPKAEVAVWPYSASNVWSRSDTLQSGLIARLPPGITWISEFDKEGAVSFGGITIPAYDYTISHVGPSERFERQSRLAKDHNLLLWAKTEHAISLEFVQTPYIPVFWSWVERYARLQRFDSIRGLLANWQHYGFMPSIATELFKWGTWKSSDSRPDVSSGEQMLRSIAERNFGPGTAADAVQAWRAWSSAFKEYPFSGPMAMGVLQKGPAHPFFFDPGYQPLQAAGRQFKNDLSWTSPWGPGLALQQLEKVESGWTAGMRHWETVVRKAAPALRRAAVREQGVAQAVLCCLRSAIHLGRFYQLREALHRESRPAEASLLLDQMETILRAELGNSRQGREVARADSRIGYANSGKGEQTGVARAGIYSPGSIAKKIAQVERVLSEEIPNYRRRKAAGGR